MVRTFFASGDDDYEYFLYKGDPKSPTLESVPLPDEDSLHGVSGFGIVPRGGDDGDQYLLVALRDAVTRKDYLLHIYSSEDRTWRTKELLNPCPGPTLAPYKVTLLRDGVLVWVDFVRGLLVCDVLQEPLLARYIPLPEPLPRNREEILKQLVSEATVMGYRDVACVDGLIKFVEMEHRVIVTTEVEDAPPEKPSDPRNKDVLYDSDLIMLYKRKRVDKKPKTLRTANGWSAMTWTRELGSHCWFKGSIVDVDDILVDDLALSALRGNESAGSVPFKKIYSSCPILSTDGNDILYLKSSRKLLDPSGWVVAVDLGEKTLKVEAANRFGRFLSCALVNHLKMTSGIKVSAFQIAPAGSSANEPNNTAICVGEPDSYKSENKRRRLLAEEDKHAQDRAQGTVQSVLSSQARPDQNNMPPQLCFNRWEKPGYSGPSSCPPQNNSPLPQCFNKSSGHCNPAYTQWAPAPNIRSYDNSQSLWQQPLLPEKLKAPSRAFETHVAHHSYSNNWRGARHHGNSQQHPSYGAHSGSGNQGFGYRPIHHDYHLGSGNHGNSQQHHASNSYSYGT